MDYRCAPVLIILCNHNYRIAVISIILMGIHLGQCNKEKII